MLVFNTLIFSFGFWNVFKKVRPLNAIFGLTFLASFMYCIGSFAYEISSVERVFMHIIPVLLGLGVLGFLLQVLASNKLAQVVAIFLAAAGINLYVSNPHKELDPSIQLDQNAELLIRVDHENKTKVIQDISNLDVVTRVTPFLSPIDTESTDLDDYVKVDVQNDIDKNMIISEINKIDGIEWIEPNEIMEVVPLESKDAIEQKLPRTKLNDPLIIRQWNVEKLRLDVYHNLFTKSKFSPKKQAHLFILDSGVSSDHEDLLDNYESINSKSADNDSDTNGHGTHCAGVAGASTNNGLGIASMNPGKQWVKVSGIKVMNRFGIGSQARIVEGIIEAVDNGADVISMSLGGRKSQLKEEAYDEAFEYAKKHNVIIVAAAGNESQDADNIVPTSHDYVISVAALNRQLKKAQFSNFVTNVEKGISAPGTSILSPWKGGRYSALDGTSMAAPHVSGLLAVMRSLSPDLSPEDAYNILNQTGTKTSENHLTGKMINPVAAVQHVVK